MTNTLEDKALTEYKVIAAKGRALYTQYLPEWKPDYNGQYVCIADINSDKPQFYFAKTADNAKKLARTDHPACPLYTKGINIAPEYRT